MTLPHDIANASFAVQKSYARMVANGQSPRFAEMAALQSPPGTKGTDRAFMQGRLNQEWLDKMPKKQADTILREAKKAGVDVTGKVYIGGLADLRAHKDPMAWVDSTADIKRVAEARNLTVEGAVTHKGTPMPPESKSLSELIIKEDLKRYRKTHPYKKDSELREMIINRHAHPSKRKKK
jgi:hypothetical protein